MSAWWGRCGRAGRVDAVSYTHLVQETGALDQAAVERGRRHQAGGGTAAQVAEGVAVGAVLHEIQAGVRGGVDLDARDIHTLFAPQRQELRAEGVIADARQVGAARALAGRGDDGVGGCLLYTSRCV